MIVEVASNDIGKIDRIAVGNAPYMHTSSCEFEALAGVARTCDKGDCVKQRAEASIDWDLRVLRHDDGAVCFTSTLSVPGSSQMYSFQDCLGICSEMASGGLRGRRIDARS